ncbi:response regulator transcription factor [Nocardioides abyssi]|uniref:Response regulator transcription factor n=1 Tax=Nocardioides abyssi TaxID=3058370 RepID=A0ABT8EQK4_9ACTN|nr:response regulator transcription factor [Nocardioides abyssi]MDN4160412.1 response regulator transcription factor [Nocardioides abyssi]
MSVQPIRVAVANDYELVVAGLAAMLAPFSEQVEVVELDSGVPVAGDVDVVLFDTFAQGDGEHVDLADILGSQEAKVVVYSWNVDPDVVDRTIDRGVAGYLYKGVGAEEIVAALEKVRDGDVVRPDGDVGLPDDGLVDGDWPGREHGLSPRESEILALITQGLSNQEIAERTYLSINSVKTYIRTAYRKIGVTRRAQAVGWGMGHGFAPRRGRKVSALD